MKQDNKDKELRERQTYVPVSVKVIKVTAIRVICQSGDTDGQIGEMGRTTADW